MQNMNLTLQSDAHTYAAQPALERWWMFLETRPPEEGSANKLFVDVYYKLFLTKMYAQITITQPKPQASAIGSPLPSARWTSPERGPKRCTQGPTCSNARRQHKDTYAKHLSDTRPNLLTPKFVRCPNCSLKVDNLKKVWQNEQRHVLSTHMQTKDVHENQAMCNPPNLVLHPPNSHLANLCKGEGSHAEKGKHVKKDFESIIAKTQHQGSIIANWLYLALVVDWTIDMDMGTWSVIVNNMSV